MAFDPRDARLAMQQERDRLFKSVRSARPAAVASEDGLLAATHDWAEPAPADRRALRSSAGERSSLTVVGPHLAIMRASSLNEYLR